MRRGRRQPGSRCTSAAAIRSASTVLARAGAALPPRRAHLAAATSPRAAEPAAGGPGGYVRRRQRSSPAQPLILAICVADKMTMGGGSGWKFTLASCVVPLVTAQVRKARRSCARVALGWEVFTTAYS